MLLAAIVSSSGIQSQEAITGRQGVSLSNVVPRLWPFLRHNILSVRKATLQTLKTILETYRKGLDKVSKGTPSGFPCGIARSRARDVEKLPEMVKKHEPKAGSFLPFLEIKQHPTVQDNTMLHRKNHLVIVL